LSQSVDAYREVLEQEIKKWNGYERALRGNDKQFFEELMNMARNYAPEARSAEKNIVFQPMLMSMILAQNKRIKRMEEELYRIKPPQETRVIKEKPLQTVVNEPKPKPTPKSAQRGLGDFG